MNLNDLFVSYNTVEIPKSELQSIKLPMNKYERFLLYVNNKKEEKKEETTLDNLTDVTADEFGFEGWSFTPNNLTTSTNSSAILTNPSTVKGSDDFENYYNEAEKLYPEARKYREFLTKTVGAEAGKFNPQQTPVGHNFPAYGYFGMSENNIKHYYGKSKEEYFNDPVGLIITATKLAESIDKQFTSEDRRVAKEKGYSDIAMLAGAWLGGVGGVRAYLHRGEDRGDHKWYNLTSGKPKRGEYVSQRMNKFNI